MHLNKPAPPPPPKKKRGGTTHWCRVWSENIPELHQSFASFQSETLKTLDDMILETSCRGSKIKGNSIKTNHMLLDAWKFSTRAHIKTTWKTKQTVLAFMARYLRQKVSVLMISQCTYWEQSRYHIGQKSFLEHVTSVMSAKLDV